HPDHDQIAAGSHGTQATNTPHHAIFEHYFIFTVPTPTDIYTLSLHDALPIYVQPGQTVAIVGQTGSGKSALSQLINRTYDVSAGRVLIDGVDVREWNLDALRSQIAKIEQDVFLFSRTLGENIAFGAPDATQEQIEQA